MSSLNVVDIIILIIFLSSMLIGFGRGFVSELISFATLILALVVAIMFAAPLADAFTSTPTVQNVVSHASSTLGANSAKPISYVAIGIAFFLLFAGVLLVGTIIGYVINTAFEFGMMSLGNRLFGALFGLVRGFIINLVFIFLIQLSPMSQQPWWQESQFVHAFQPAVQWLGNLVSPALSSLKSKVEEGIQKVNTQIKSALEF